MNQDELNRRLSETDWNQLYCETNVHVAANYIEDSIRRTLEELAPLKKIQPKKNHRSWLSDRH